MSYFDFGGILKSLRKRNGLSQSELGKHIGLSKAVISNYENGINYPDYENLIRMAEYFGVTTDYLLGVTNVKTVDVSRLTESQIEVLNQVIAEFIAANEKYKNK